MKIAQVAPLTEAVPPPLYGGIERTVSDLTEALVSLGHDVTLFAAQGSVSQARLVTYRDRPLRLDPAAQKSSLASHLDMLGDLRERAEEFDVLHFHTHLLHFPLFEHMAGKTITTLNGRLDVDDFAAAFRCWPQFPLVSVSLAQRVPLPDLNWIANVPHGIDATAYGIDASASGDYLVFLGRFSPEKRPDRAIDIARRAGMPLKIAAKVDDDDREYFVRYIQPSMYAPDIESLGEIGDVDKARLLRGARALLFPIDWPEPFGLVMIEAMACGTPVIAWRHGSVPEVIEDGVTGFIVDDIDAAVHAVERAEYLDRRTMRLAFEARFTAAGMADGYLRAYARLVDTLPDMPKVYP